MSAVRMLLIIMGISFYGQAFAATGTIEAVGAGATECQSEPAVAQLKLHLILQPFSSRRAQPASRLSFHVAADMEATLHPYVW